MKKINSSVSLVKNQNSKREMSTKRNPSVYQISEQKKTLNQTDKVSYQFSSNKGNANFVFHKVNFNLSKQKVDNDFYQLQKLKQETNVFLQKLKEEINKNAQTLSDVIYMTQLLKKCRNLAQNQNTAIRRIVVALKKALATGNVNMQSRFVSQYENIFQYNDEVFHMSSQIYEHKGCTEQQMINLMIHQKQVLAAKGELNKLTKQFEQEKDESELYYDKQKADQDSRAHSLKIQDLKSKIINQQYQAICVQEEFFKVNKKPIKIMIVDNVKDNQNLFELEEKLCIKKNKVIIQTLNNQKSINNKINFDFVLNYKEDQDFYYWGKRKLVFYLYSFFIQNFYDLLSQQLIQITQELRLSNLQQNQIKNTKQNNIFNIFFIQQKEFSIDYFFDLIYDELYYMTQSVNNFSKIQYHLNEDLQTQTEMKQNLISLIQNSSLEQKHSLNINISFQKSFINETFTIGFLKTQKNLKNFLQEKIKLNEKDFLVFTEKTYSPKDSIYNIEDIKDNFQILNDKYSS